METASAFSISRVLILGAGTMGLQIGVQCAAHGFETLIFDPFEAALEKAARKMPGLAASLADAGRITPDQAKAVPGRIRLLNDPEAAGRDADLLSESVPEDPGLKADVLARFNRICPDRTIFTTNTSTLVPSMLARATGRPDRFAALHFHDCHLTNVVDVMGHPGTSPQTLASILDFCAAIHQFPIELKKEQHGYVFNTMLTELLGAALGLAAKGVALPRDIDRAWMGIMKTRIGPFGIMDAVGLETVYRITAYWAGKKEDARSRANADYLKGLVDQGHLGIKTGQGFYTYPEPEFAQPQFLKGIC